MRPTEIIFQVTEACEGGYDARALGYSIFTRGDDWEDLKAMARDAVLCHFEDDDAPRVIRLRRRFQGGLWRDDTVSVKSKRPGPGEGKPRELYPDDELLRRARAGEIRLGRPNSEAVYTRPPKDQRLPHEEVMALLDWVRGDR